MSIANVEPDRLAEKPPSESEPNESFWSSLKYFSYYRLIVASVLLATARILGSDVSVGSQDPRLFAWICSIYLLVAISSLVILSRWKRAFNLQLTMQVVGDIFCLSILLYASGGAKSGIAMMLLIVLVGAGLVGQGRMVVFYAALASVALLLEQAYRVVVHQGDAGDFFRTGLTSIAFFGSAIAARLLARRVVANEELARRRGIELADQLRINERVIRDMQDGVLVIDARGRIRLANPQAALLGGLTVPLGHVLAAYSPVLAHEFVQRQGRQIESEVVMQMPRSGRSIRARFLPPGDGGNVLIFLEDMGRLQQEALQVKLAALGRLTANMAHEIRNPLSAISHAAELLSEESDARGAQRLVRIIGDNTQRLNRLVSEVTELGRRDRATPETISIGVLVGQVLDEMALRDQRNRPRIELNMPDDLRACFDQGHFHRVITNLLDNALRYASFEAGAVRVIGERCHSTGRTLIHVIDNGPGVGEVERNQIFEPFFTTRAAGTGLGLYIARELCEANGARLSLLENAPGAHFCISCAPSCNDNH